MKDTHIQHPFYQQLQKGIDKTDRKATRYSWLFYIIKVILIALGVVITILSGIAADTRILLVLGAVTTGLTSLDALFQTGAKKTTYKLILDELRSVRTEFVFVYIRNEKISKDDLDLLYEKYKNALSYGRDLSGSDSDETD